MTCWLNDFMTCCIHADFMNYDLLTSWLADLMTCWLHDLLNSWLHDLLTSWLADFMTCWLHDFITPYPILYHTIPKYTIPYQLSFQLGLGLNFQDFSGGECGITANLSSTELPAGAGTELGNIQYTENYLYNLREGVNNRSLSDQNLTLRDHLKKEDLHHYYL